MIRALVESTATITVYPGMRLAKPMLLAVAGLLALVVVQGGCGGDSDPAAGDAGADGGDPADASGARAYRCTGADLEYCALYGTLPTKPPTTSPSCGSRTTCTKAADCFPLSCTCDGKVTSVERTCTGGCCLDLADTCKSVCAGNGIPDAGPSPTPPPPAVDAGTICALWAKQETCASARECRADTGRCGCTTCASVGATCGAIDDGCGATAACGDCSGTTWCGGGGSANKCGCTPGATSAGPLEAGKGANVAGIGTRTWAYTDGIVPPSADAGSSTRTAEVSGMTTGEVSNWLVATSFKVDVPPAAIIQGVEFAVSRSALSGYAIVDNAVRLVKAGNIETTERAKPDIWPQDASTVTYGGPTDLWGTTLTATDVRDGNFGLAMSAKFTSTAGNDWPRVARIKVKVYFGVTCN